MAAADAQEWSIKQHIKEKGMWAGAVTRVENNVFQMIDEDGNFSVKKKAMHTPALLKIFDELIVNAVDHISECAKLSPKLRVKQINILFDVKNGNFTIRNDGLGISTKIQEEISKKEKRNVHMPEVIFGYELAGTSLDHNPNSIKGATNGLGAKIANIHSLSFKLTTIDPYLKQKYVQKWTDRKENCELPIISTTSDPPYTCIELLPAYAALDYKNITKEDLKEIMGWIKFRTVQASSYAGKSGVTFTFNGTPIAIRDSLGLAKLMTADMPNTIIDQGFLKSDTGIIWDVAIAIIAPDVKNVLKDYRNNIMVNGTITPRGPHIRHIENSIIPIIEDKLKKKKKAEIKNTEVSGQLRFFASCVIPGAVWDSQNKDTLNVKNAEIKVFSFQESFIKSFSNKAVDRILAKDLNVKKSQVNHDKYTPAKFLNKAKEKQHLSLLAGEGDSAISLLKTILNTNKKVSPGGPSTDYYGIISVQGVVMNSVRQVDEHETESGTVLTMKDKLKDSERLNKLADAFGLDYNKKYTTDAEMRTLKYNRLILCVDQDLDGVGKIAGLLLAWLNQFWPALFYAGKIGRYLTPLIRAYPKSKKNEIYEFYYDYEYEDWCDEIGDKVNNYDIKYYKGLAAHNKQEAIKMAVPSEFIKNIHMYKPDDRMNDMFKIMFEKDSKPRKVILATPIQIPSKEALIEYKKERVIPMTEVQLLVEVKSYKRDDVHRKIPSFNDGLNPTRRKVVAGSFMKLKGIMKIFQVAGLISAEMNYHHGDASINNTITLMAQEYIGARRYPLLCGDGQFGDRHGLEAGSARYIGVSLNPIAKVIFPPEDIYFLNFTFEDNKRVEPDFYSPIIPMALLESYIIVAEGWNHKSYARNAQQVLTIVKAFINGDKELIETADLLANQAYTGNFTPELFKMLGNLMQKWPLDIELEGYTCDVRHCEGKVCLFGRYEYYTKERILKITELPIGISTLAYIDDIKKKKPHLMKLIESINETSPPDRVEIEIKLLVGSYEHICEKYGNEEVDPIEDAFKLKLVVNSNLNYYGNNGQVLEFSQCYIAPLLLWAVERQRVYEARIMRQKIIAEIQIFEEDEILRYIESGIDLRNVKDDVEAIKILKKHNFTPLNKTLLHSPKFTPNYDLEDLIKADDAPFDYLLDLRDRDRMQHNIEKRLNNREKYIQSLKNAMSAMDESPVGASIWLSEINNFEKICHKTQL